MIGYLKGMVASVSDGVLLLDVHEIGYQVLISTRDASVMPGVGEAVQVYTLLSVSQDALRLYGFLNEDDLEIFKMLLNVNGVGPKAALGILSALTADELRFAVLSDDARSIAKAPGIGAKSAQKIILELRDKFSLEDTFEQKPGKTGGGIPMAGSRTSAQDEAVQALTALGYSAADALRAVRNCGADGDMDTETILKLALRNL